MAQLALPSTTRHAANAFSQRTTPHGSVNVVSSSIAMDRA